MKLYLLIPLLCLSAQAQTTISSLLPPYPNDATKFLNGAGKWTTPAGSGSGNVVGSLINTNTTAAGELVKFTDTSKTNTAPASSADIQAALGSVYAPLASPLLTGTPEINGQSIETQLTNKVDKVVTATQTMSGPLSVPDLLSGGYSVTRATLTHAGNVTLDCGITNRYASITLTGNVTFVTANLSAGKWYNLIITMTATNDTPTFPAWKWLGGAPSQLTASQIGVLSIYPTSTTDDTTLAAYAETQ